MIKLNLNKIQNIQNIISKHSDEGSMIKNENV